MNPNEYPALFEAEQRHWWFLNLRNEVSHWIKQRTAESASAGKNLLDLGCGTGGMLLHLQETFKGLNACGLDYYTFALDFARQRTVYPLVQGDVKSLPFKKETFDFIVCLDVLYTKEAYPGFQNAINTIHTLLKPGGILIMQLPAFEFLKSEHDTNVHGMHRFTANELRRSFRLAGFDSHKVYYRYNLLFGIALLVRKIIKTVDHDKSHVVRPPSLVNALFQWYFSCESWFNKRLSIPFGLSVFAVAYR